MLHTLDQARALPNSLSPMIAETRAMMEILPLNVFHVCPLADSNRQFRLDRRVGKGAPSRRAHHPGPDARPEWWARRRTRSRPSALPTLRAKVPDCRLRPAKNL